MTDVADVADRPLSTVTRTRARDADKQCIRHIRHAGRLRALKCRPWSSVVRGVAEAPTPLQGGTRP